MNLTLSINMAALVRQEMTAYLLYVFFTKDIAYLQDMKRL